MTNVPPIVTERFIPTPDGSLFVRQWAPAAEPLGAPFLLLHDSLGCVELWRDFGALLAQRTQRSVFAYDRLGFGKSQRRHGGLDLNFISEESQRFIPHLLAQLRLDRFVAFGHSVGGGMALYCGIEFPTACEGIVVEGAQMFVEEITLQGIRQAKEKYSRPANLERLEKYHGDKAEWVVRAWTETWLNPQFAAWHARDALPRIKCPILAIHGDQDEFGSLLHPQLIVALGGGRVQASILPGCGHLPHKEQPGAIIDSVMEFVGA